MTEKMVKFCTGELQLCNEDGVTIGGGPLRGKTTQASP